MDRQKVQGKVDVNEAFYPKGAIAFFVSMLGVFGLIWLGMYALLIHRHSGL